MAEPLKYVYTQQFITDLSLDIKKHYKYWKHLEFISAVFNKNWQALELKQRMGHIAESLYRFLPKSYGKAIDILIPVSQHRGGFESMFFPDFVAKYGVNEWSISMRALKHFTQFSSSEFAVRPFIIKYPQKMMKQMLKWAHSDNHQVRRLSSEGCRPRLPWAMVLPELKRDPTLIWPILEVLKRDPSAYVRKSVANNLNDISKDHPKSVIDFSKNNYGVNTQTDWVLKHGLRSLLKSGDSQALNIIGYQNPKNLVLKHFKKNREVKIGQDLSFSFELISQELLGFLRVEYAISFLRQRGKLNPKVFKISESKITSTNKTYSKSHSFKPISTRRYYPGRHELTIIINGKPMASGHFKLIEDT